MKNYRSYVFGLIGLTIFFAGQPVFADDRVLIMTISDYPGQALEGVKHDANNGFVLAKKLGYETSAAVRLRDRELTLAGLKNALQNLVEITKNGDRVFIYFSGHGGSSKRENVCEQSIIAQDAQPLFSNELASYLTQIKDTASKVTVMLDSCHSGGVLNNIEQVRSAAKSSGGAQIKAKAWVPKNGEVCSNGINYVPKTISAMRGAKSVTDLSSNFVYITAARENEYALDNPASGGLASTSLLKCLDKGNFNSDQSGIASVGELAQCSQTYIDQGVESINSDASPSARSKWAAPHINVVGNVGEPILGAQAQIPTTSASTNKITPSSTSVVAINTLKRIHDGQDARWGFHAQPTKAEGPLNSKIKIHYTSNQGGYVYVLYVGSDGKEFKQLYPIELGQTRYLAKTDGYVGKDGGAAEVSIEPPIGTNHFLVLLADTHRDFSGIFKAGQDGELLAPANTDKANSLGCAAAGGTRNAKMTEGQASCSISRNAGMKEGDSASNLIPGYGASMFTVKGIK